MTAPKLAFYGRKLAAHPVGALLCETNLGVAALIPELFQLNLVRLILGSILVLCLPGYTSVQLLFSKGSGIDDLERVALSVGVSVAIAPLIGLVLNFTPWGIRFGPITASLGAFVVISAIGAAIRQYLALRK